MIQQAESGESLNLFPADTETCFTKMEVCGSVAQVKFIPEA